MAPLITTSTVRRSAGQAQAGLTGRDMLVCGLLLGLLALFIVPALIVDPDHNMRQVSTRSDMKAIASALASYKLDNATYPSTRQGLDALVHAPAGEPAAPHWKGYLKEAPKDAWGNPYHYAAPGPTGGELYVLWSFGSDGRPGGEDSAADIFLRYPTQADPS